MAEGITVNLVEADPIVVNVTDGPDPITATIVEEVIQVTVDGIVGPVGPPGGNYRHIQAAPATTWTVEHNLGFRPSVSVEDSGGSNVIGDVVYVDANTLTITFDVPFGGYANCS